MDDIVYVGCTTAISKKNAGPYKLVTVDGEVINAAGAITGGSFTLKQTK